MPEGLAAFRNEVELKKRLKEAPPELRELYKDQENAQRLERDIAEARRRNLVAEVRRASAVLRRSRSKIDQERITIEANDELKRAWDEIEELRRPPRRGR